MIRVNVEFVVPGGQIYQKKTVGFQYTEITQQSKNKIEGNRNERNINILKAPNERPYNEEDLLSPCRISFKFLKEALKYAQYQFENKLWNKNEILRYVRTCCSSKNVAFNAIGAFQQGQEYYGLDV